MPYVVFQMISNNPRYVNAGVAYENMLYPVKAITKIGDANHPESTGGALAASISTEDRQRLARPTANH